jgi:hypothetical protein
LCVAGAVLEGSAMLVLLNMCGVLSVTKNKLRACERKFKKYGTRAGETCKEGPGSLIGPIGCGDPEQPQSVGGSASSFMRA